MYCIKWLISLLWGLSFTISGNSWNIQAVYAGYSSNVCKTIHTGNIWYRCIDKGKYSLVACLLVCGWLLQLVLTSITSSTHIIDYHKCTCHTINGTVPFEQVWQYDLVTNMIVLNRIISTLERDMHEIHYKSCLSDR